jgi:endoglucanase
MIKKSKLISALCAFAVLASSATVTAGISFAGNLIRNSTFDGGVGLPWNQVETFPADGDFDISGGKYNITINNIGDSMKGTSANGRWDVQFRHRGLVIEQGHTYNVKFTVVATKDCAVYPKIGDQGDPYYEVWNYNNRSYQLLKLKANVPVTVNETFTYTGETRKTCEFAFHLVGDCSPAGETKENTVPWTVSFDDIYLTDPQYTEPAAPTPDPNNAIRVNQVGYFPNMEKKATVVSSSTTPIDWKLLDSSKNVVASGKTTVFGADKASGDNVHEIDFSSYNTVGTGYTITTSSGDTNTLVSMPFAIGNNLYTTMKDDSLKYFYLNRSGMAITMPYAGRTDLTRAAGHPSDVMSNAADTWYTKQYNPNYTLDLTGGWYDAGDHGKYVVNGGISTWTMMNEYERALLRGDATVAPYKDGGMNIPESGNGYPDMLDESRYNLACLLKMQVPAGNALAGMVHHKAHDERWTALGIRPDQDPMKRYLQPPSTAATLNLAAIAAQGSRLWQKYDSTFATKCLTAAETAWDAAVLHPDIFAPLNSSVGGGAYGDNYVKDDFYWAACELYATTGKAKYLDYIKASPHYLQMPTTLTGGEDKGLTGSFDWGNTAGMGTITLALTAPSGISASDIAIARANIVAAADKFIDISNKQGYGIPLEESTVDITTATDTTPGKTITGLPWGSNSFVANEAITMAYAYEFSGKDIKYINGAEQSMDYLLGRNPNVISYVTGYGAYAAQNPHHRFWAYQTDNSFPKAPAGCLVGGPNSGLQDPWVKGAGWLPGMRTSEKCYLDNIESWSTNEVTINWNAPLAWISDYLNEEGPKVSNDKVLYGDLNGDKLINSIDLALMKRYVLGTISSFPSANGAKAADVNGDGTINTVDYSLMKRFTLGVISKFPADK